MASDKDESVCCPRCLTVNVVGGADAGKQCGHCQLDLGWLEKCPKTKRALAKAASGRVELVVDVKWSGGGATSRYQGESPFKIVVGDQEVAQIIWEESRRKVRITIGDEDKAYRLPTEFPDGKGKQYNIRSVAVPASDGGGNPEQIGNASKDKQKDRPLLRETWEDSIGCIEDNFIQAPSLDDNIHCVVARQQSANRDQTDSPQDSIWLIDYGDSCKGTFVNGKPIIAYRLCSGDLVQAGPYAWQFHHSKSRDVFLRSQVAIHGATVRLNGTKIAGRLGPLTYEFRPGELVAIRGPSGSGKSTLVNAIIGAEPLTDGTIGFGRYSDISQNREELRRHLGYVPQGLIIHEHLTAKQVVQFAAKFRGRRKKVADGQVENALRSVDLDNGRWNAPVKKLSGGEQQRVKIAAEVINNPELFVLDEPTSGLDGSREDEMLRMLHVLSRRGATVVVVTHGEHRVFDRTLVIEKQGKLKEALDSDGTLPSSSDAEAPASTPETDLLGADSTRDNQTKENLRKRVREWTRVSWQQGSTHFRREWAILIGDWLWRLVLPLMGVPLLFALALALSVPSRERALLGFLSVLCCIWMGASLSLLSIAAERRVIDHERLVFLNVFPYMSAKTLALWILSMFQSLVFLGALWLFLWLFQGPEDFLCGGVRMAMALVAVGFAGVGVGLLLSAVSGTSVVMANFLLPLIMIAQIVFSVAIAIKPDSYQGVYRGFSWSLGSPAAKVSYLTLSRWGDMAVRPLQDGDQTQGCDREVARRTDYWWGVGVLGTATIILPVLSGVMVWLAPWTRRVLARFWEAASTCALSTSHMKHLARTS